MRFNDFRFNYMKTVCLICGKKGNNKEVSSIINGKEIVTHGLCSNPECEKKFWEDCERQMKEIKDKENIPDKYSGIDKGK